MPRVARKPDNRHRDREIVRLALPALGALAAEPSYRLVDTAIVGHLGVAQLGGLAIAVTLFASAFLLFNFLAYGTTARVARAFGAGRPEDAGALGGQALWMALALGVAMIGLGQLVAEPAIALMGGEGAVADKAETYLRIALLGSPFVLVVMAGEGYLRGVKDLITPLKILLVSNVANVFLEVLFVYGFDWDIAGSAWGTLIAQAGAGVAFAVILVRASGRHLRPSWTRMRSLVAIGRPLLVRTAALLMFFSFMIALVARESDVELAANEVIFEIFIFLALSFDSLAIAAQTMIGNLLGAGELDETRAVARRLTLWAFVTGTVLLVVLLAGHELIPQVFTSSEAVLAALAGAWTIFALQQPMNAVVFAWDGVLFGAGDAVFMMRAMLVSATTAAAVAYVAIGGNLVPGDGLGLTGAWLAVSTLIAMRLAICGRRVAGSRWLVAGV